MQMICHSGPLILPHPVGEDEEEIVLFRIIQIEIVTERQLRFLLGLLLSAPLALAARPN